MRKAEISQCFRLIATCNHVFKHATLHICSELIPRALVVLIAPSSGDIDRLIIKEHLHVEVLSVEVGVFILVEGEVFLVKLNQEGGRVLDRRVVL